MLIWLDTAILTCDSEIHSGMREYSETCKNNKDMEV